MSIALTLSKEKLVQIEQEIEGKVGKLVTERDQLVKDIKKLERGTGSNGSTPAIPDEKLVSTVKELTADGKAVKSTDIAAALSVDSRTIARRLAKMAQDGDLQGDKESGYSA